MLLLAAIDQGVYGLSAGAFRETADLNSFAAAQPLPPPTPHSRIVASPPQSPFRTGNRWLLAGFARADGYVGLEPQRRLDYHADKVQRLAGVGYSLLAPTGPVDRERQLESQPASRSPPTAEKWHAVERRWTGAATADASSRRRAEAGSRGTRYRPCRQPGSSLAEAR